MANFTASKKEVRDVIANLQGGAKYKNEQADYFFCLRKDGERVAYIRGEYKFFKSLERFAVRIIKAVKTGE